MAPQPSFLVPLYVYPNPGAWEPLYQAATTHPNLDFTVVVNPHSGPGLTPLPDANYTREIPRLNGFDNIRTLGYVATDYAKKSLDDITGEIATYAAWSTQDSTFTLDGVFFDETPTQYDPDVDAFMRKISTTVQEEDGLAEGFVVHNPGYVPDDRYMAYADLTVVFEQTYSTWANNTVALLLEDLNYNRNNLVTLMHSLPAISDDSAKILVNHLRLFTGHVFLTDLDTDYYAGFSSQFAKYVALMA